MATLQVIILISIANPSNNVLVDYRDKKDDDDDDDDDSDEKDDDDDGC